MPSTAPLITPSMHDLADDLRLIEHGMIRAVATAGGRDRNEILDFQMFVNRNLPLLNQMLRQSRPDLVSGGARFLSLVEDADWGRNTAAALTLALVLTAHSPISLPPPRSVDVPPWYAQNRGAIDELITAVSTATPTPLTSSQTIPSSLNQQQTVQDILDAGADAAKQVTATPIPQGAPLSAPIVAMQDTTPPQVMGQPTNLNLSDKEILALEVDTDFASGPYGDSEGRVITARRGSRVPWFAIGGGAAALGGLLWWWTKRRKRAA
jgi:hypothetical protein